MKLKQTIKLMAVLVIALLAGSSSSWAYYSDWKYTTTAKDNGREGDGGNYTFRYDSDDTKGNFMNFKTYFNFNAANHMYKWNWDIRVNYGTVDDGNTTRVTLTIEYADGRKNDIAEAEFVGTRSPTVTWSSRPVYFSKIKDSGEFKYMFTLEYQPTQYDLQEGVRRIYVCCVTEWGKKNRRNFQYERDLDISSFKNMMPDYSCNLDGEGNYLFKVTGVNDPKANTNAAQSYKARYFKGRVSYGSSSYGDETVQYTLKEDTRTGGTEEKGDYTFTIPVKSYTVPLRISQLNYTADVKRTTLFYAGTDHYEYTVKSTTGDAYQEGILFKPYTRVDKLNVSFDKWKKKNLIEWTRNEKVSDYVNRKTVWIDCLTDGTWYVLRYEKGQAASSYEVIKEISGNSSNLKVEDSEIGYDKEYVYRVVFLPKILKEQYEDKLVSLPGESARHTAYDLWEEQSVKTTMDVPIKLTQDRSDDTGTHLVWEYNVQAKGCEWRIDKHKLGETTWNTVTTLPVDIQQGTASYLEEGGSVCDLYTYRVMTKINDKELYSDTLVCNLPAGAYIKEVKATTGTEEKFVKVKWKVARPGDDDIWFRILRRPVGSDEWTLLNDEMHGHATEYEFIDDRVMAGSYYEYSVEAYGAKCDEQLVQTSRMIAPGFSQARGTITGHVSYGTGTAVGGVRVNLIKSSANESTDQPQFLSRFIEGDGKGLQWTADVEKYKKVLNGKQPMTLQLWVRPMSTDDAAYKHVVTLDGGLELGVKTDNGSDYYLYAFDPTNPLKAMSDYPELALEKNDFTHVSAVYSEGAWTFYTGTDTLRSDSLLMHNSDWTAVPGESATGRPTLTIGGSNMLSEGGSLPHVSFSGFVDDIRLWNIALSRKEIETYYTRILGGTEDGLVLYWPLDEGVNVRDYVFDVACQDGRYQLNHPEVGINALPSATVPQDKYLGLYGLTDQEGDYIIRGIPFQQGGTNYKLAPELGIHEFNPNTRSMFISSTSLTANNIDFEDVSSFPMTGHIYYAGTNIPAEGIQFYVDGDLLTGNGEVKQTDNNGYYEISVPIGHHYVEAKLSGHTMVAGGRFPTKGTFNFDRPMQYDFVDSTLVNFVGRVGGGERNDTLAVGFGASKNNIGMATIQLKLNNESFSFNCQDDHISDATTLRTWESDTVSIASKAWTGTDYDAKYIYIRTDSLTGEFSALLPPLKYITKSISIKSNSDIVFSSLPEIDLTNALKELKDSLNIDQEGNEGEWKYYAYNTKMIRSYFAQPQLDMVEGSNPKGAYGIQALDNYEIDYGYGTEKFNIGDIWKEEENGEISYLFGLPLYEMDDKYTYNLFAYEKYVNKDSGEAVADIIPLNGQEITITNEMSNDQPIVYKVDDPASGFKVGQVYDPKSDVFQLGNDGRGSYRWQAGLPNITKPYTRGLNISMVRKDRTYVLANLNAIVLGHLSSGNNFVTKGPDIVNFVLRDPPGAKSKTTLKKAKYTQTCKVTTDKAYGDEKWCVNWLGGYKTETAAGVAVMVITRNEAAVDITTGAHVTWEKGSKDESKTNVTTTESISTGDAYPYVGSAGDVFVGTSTNLLIGEVRSLCITKKDKDGPYELDVVDAYSLGSEISTGFKYSQYEVETVMIPKWKDQRERFMTEVSDSLTAWAYKNNGDRSVYLTWYKPTDEDYGRYGYRYVTPEDKSKIHKDEIDSVDYCTKQIDRWIYVLEQNEKEKVEAIENGDFENFSIDGGTTYTYSSHNEKSEGSGSVWTYRGGFVGCWAIGRQWDVGVRFGTNFTLTTENGRTESSENITTEGDYQDWEYTIVDGNRDTDISINKYSASKSNDRHNHSDIFTVFGGQTYNPYEGQEFTKYYKKGTPLGNGTEQMERPSMSISITGQSPSKNVMLTDIPAGQEANLTLHCTNMASAHQGVNFLYDLFIKEPTNTNGLEILMDGVPINGRALMISQGETVTKQITIRQTDTSILDYEGVELRFASKYQPLMIFDDVTINAHFVPSSSPIDLAVDEPVLNTETLVRNDSNVILKLKDYDRLFKNLRYVGVQYRFEGNTQWNTIHTYVTNKKDSLNKSYSLLPDRSDVTCRYNMWDDNMFPQGTYQFRAFTTTMYGDDPVNVYSPEVTVVKDNVRPRNLTTPLPANGILRYGDDMVVEFNEDIVPGYVTDKNIIVTAKLNNQPVQHNVAVHLSRRGGGAKTVNPVFLNGDFSIDFWLNRESNGTVLQLGMANNLFSLGFINDHAVLCIAGKEIVSRDVVPQNEWTYFVLSCKAADNTFSLLAQYGNQTVRLFDNEQLPVDNTNAVFFSDNNCLNLGPISASIHDLSLFKVYRDVNEAAATKYETKDNYVYGLTNYWPMNEGHGTVIADKRHTHDMILGDNWKLDNINHSLWLSTGEGAEADISHINTSRGDSYAIELWAMVNSYMEGENIIFETGSKPSNRLRLYYNNRKDLVLDYGERSQVVANAADFSVDNDANHLALNVVRGQSASFYFNGQRTAVIAEADVPPMEGATMRIGKGFNGFVDEVRIWKATLSESRLLGNMYNCIDTTDVYSRGLVAYYPFEKPGEENGVATMVPTLENMIPSAQPQTALVASDYEMLGSFAPLKNAPVESRLIAKPVASERKVVIHLETGSGIKARDVEGTTLNITVDKIHDMHGNESLPLRWQAYVQQNTLKWMKDSVNVIKKYGDDYTFDVDIENRSGNTEFYTLYNMPQWLTLVDSERTDDVSPLSQKKLRFRVNPLVAVGNYDVTIGLQGNFEILEPLRLVMKVSGEAPDWTVDPLRYENTMSIVGQIYIDGILMADNESRLAAFIGDECRGVASPKQIRGSAYVPMTIYGTAQQEVNGQPADLEKGLPVTFRIWDASTGVTYTNVKLNLPDATSESSDNAVYALSFDPTVSCGTFDYPVVFSKSNIVEQYLNLNTGWNWLSMGVEPDNAKTATVFKDVTSWNVRLKDRSTGVAYSKGVYWAGTLKEVHANTMYKMLLSRLEESKDLPQPLIVTGQQVKLAETPVTLENGWNWIAYIPTTTMTLDEALAGANPQIGDQVKSQTGFAYYGPYGWEGNLEALESGKGYLYESVDSEKKSFVYPTKTAGNAMARGVVKAEKPHSAFAAVAVTDYPDNMSMVIRLIEGGYAVTDAELAVFVDGECRGTAFADGDLYYLLAAGEGSGQSMELRISIGGKTVTIDSSLTYSSDSSIGTPWRPYVIDLNGSVTGIADRMGKIADDADWYTLQGFKLDHRPTQPGVYLHGRRKVTIRPTKTIYNNDETNE